MVDFPADVPLMKDPSLNWDALVFSTQKSSDETSELMHEEVLQEIRSKLSIDFGSFSDFEKRKVDA